VVVPEGLAILVHGHVNLILARAADRVELLQQELDEFGLLLLVDLGQTIDNHKGVVTLFQLHLILLTEIRDIDLILIELFLVQVGLTEMFESGRHVGRTTLVPLRCRYAQRRKWFCAIDGG
jgi:hypothetical protein